MERWTVDLTYIEEWLVGLPDEQYDDVLIALSYLAEVGPAGG